MDPLLGGTQFLFVPYVPFLSDLFHFSTPHAADLTICLTGGVLSILWFESLMVFRRKSSAAA